jgi:hypothetical protein
MDDSASGDKSETAKRHTIHTPWVVTLFIFIGSGFGTGENAAADYETHRL